MALTRANVEQITIKRLGKLMLRVELDGETVSGSNADLNDAIGWAARQVGLTVADVSTVASSDISSLAVDNYDWFFDLVEYRQLRSVQNQLVGDDVLQKNMQGFAFLVAAVERRIEAQLEHLKREYGFSVGTLAAGIIDLGFTQQFPTTE